MKLAIKGHPTRGKEVIKLLEMLGGKKQCESGKLNTFYHELTHAILATMGETELDANEKFVSTFSSFLPKQ